MPFEGFPAATFRFLRELGKHNEKAWFDAHRDDYEAFFLAPALAFIEAIGPKLRKISRSVHAEARVNGSLFRINRDVRFSRDKSPYKDHLDMWFWEGEERGWESTGFYMRLTHDRLLLGAGIHHFGKPQLAAYRAAVVDAKKGKALATTVAALERGGYRLGEATRKAVPRGFDAGHERAALLLHEGLHGVLDERLPKAVSTPGLVDYCAKHFAALYPVSKWIQGAVL